MTGLLYENRTQRDTGEALWRQEGGWSHVATSPGTPEASEAGRGRKVPVLERPEGEGPAHIWILDSRLRNWERLSLSGSGPQPSVRSFVTAAPGGTQALSSRSKL